MADFHRDGNAAEERDRLKRMESGRAIEYLSFLRISLVIQSAPGDLFRGSLAIYL